MTFNLDTYIFIGNTYTFVCQRSGVTKTLKIVDETYDMMKNKYTYTVEENYHGTHTYTIKHIDLIIELQRLERSKHWKQQC